MGNNRLRLPLPVTGIPDTDKMSDVQMRLLYDLDSDPQLSEQLLSNAFPNLSVLVLVRCYPLTWLDVRRIMRWVPMLRSLSLAYNEVSRFFASPLLSLCVSALG